MLKKALLAMLLFAATLGIAQDGRTKIVYINQTSQTLRMLIDGNAACGGDVIPNGMCTEPVNPGTYTVGATNGKQSVSRDITVDDGQTFQYTITEEDSDNLLPDQSRVHLVSTPANYDEKYDDLGFFVVSPIVLTRETAAPGTTHTGITYTYTVISGTYANNDALMVGVSNYGAYTIVPDDLQRAADGFTKGINGTIVKQESVTLNSGQLGLMFDVELPPVNGKTQVFMVLDTYKGNTLYQVVFGSYKETPSDMEGVKKFFSSFTIL